MKKYFYTALPVFALCFAVLSGCGDDFNISPCRKGEREQQHRGSDNNKQQDSTAVNTPAVVTQPGS